MLVWAVNGPQMILRKFLPATPHNWGRLRLMTLLSKLWWWPVREMNEHLMLSSVAIYYLRNRENSWISWSFCSMFGLIEYRNETTCSFVPSSSILYKNNSRALKTLGCLAVNVLKCIHLCMAFAVNRENCSDPTAVFSFTKRVTMVVGKNTSSEVDPDSHYCCFHVFQQRSVCFSLCSLISVGGAPWNFESSQLSFASQRCMIVETECIYQKQWNYINHSLRIVIWDVHGNVLISFSIPVTPWLAPAKCQGTFVNFGPFLFRIYQLHLLEAIVNKMPPFVIWKWKTCSFV